MGIPGNQQHLSFLGSATSLFSEKLIIRIAALHCNHNSDQYCILYIIFYHFPSWWFAQNNWVPETEISFWCNRNHLSYHQRPPQRLAGLIIEVVDALEFVRPSARSRCYKFYVVKIRPLNAVLRQQRFGKHKEEKMKWRRLVLFVDAIEADIRKGKQLEPPQKRLFWRTLEGSEKGWKEGSKQSWGGRQPPILHWTLLSNPPHLMFVVHG